MNDQKIFYLCKISNLDDRRIVHLRNVMYNRKHLCQITNDDEYIICTRSQAGPLFNVLKPNCEAFRRNICYSGSVD